MRVVIQDEIGTAETLRLTETDKPKPGDGEVLVEVRAAGVNPVDVAVRNGRLPLLGEPPFGVGWDVSGVVAEVGVGTDFAVGEEVFGMPFFPREARGYADFVVSPADHLIRKPESLSHQEAAAVPLAALTAWQCLVTTAGVSKGDKVLIHRAAGGVGHFAIQIAKAQGAHVIALASAPKHDFVRQLGADEVIDHQSADFTEMVSDLDVVLDSAWQGDASASVLRAGGKLVTITQPFDEELTQRVRDGGRELHSVTVVPSQSDLEEIRALVNSGAVRVHIAATYELAEVKQAHEFLETRNVIGKVVLSV